MRELSDKEKAIIKKLIELYDPVGTMKIGDVIISNCNISYMKKTSDPRLVRLSYWQGKQNRVEGDIIEAVALLHFFRQNSYIFLSKIIHLEEMGTDFEMAEIITEDYFPVTTNLVNPFDFDLWDFLSSNYVVTNALRDLVDNDFKTIEQRRFEIQLKKAKWSLWYSQASFVVAMFALIFTILYSLFGTTTVKINDYQYEELLNNNDLLREIDATYSNPLQTNLFQTH